MICVRWFLNRHTQPLVSWKNVFHRWSKFKQRWNNQQSHHTYLGRRKTSCNYYKKTQSEVFNKCLGNLLVGPYILPNQPNSPIYMVFLRYPWIATWIVHQSNYGTIVHDYLHHAFVQKWFGRGGAAAIIQEDSQFLNEFSGQYLIDLGCAKMLKVVILSSYCK